MRIFRKPALIFLLILLVASPAVFAKTNVRLMWDSNLGVCTRPNLCDIDGDGELEIVGLFQDLSTEDGKTHIAALSGSTGQVKWKFPSMGTACRDYPASDIDGDGKTEVMAFDGKSLLVISGAGKIRRKIKVSEELSNIAILDGPVRGKKGILTLAGREASLIDGAKGSVIWKKKLPSGASFVTLFDIDGDGCQDAVISCQDRVIEAVNGRNGSSFWHRIYGTGYEWAYTAAGNFAGDGKPRLLAAMGIEGALMIIDLKTGNVEKKLPLKTGLFIPLDWNGDGRLEVLGTAGGLSLVEPSSGKVLWKNSQIPSGESPSVLRVNSEKNPLILTADHNQMLNIVSSTDGEPRWRQKIGHNASYVTPVAGDFNGDGVLNFFAESRAYSLGDSGTVEWMGNRGDGAYSGDPALAARYGQLISNLQKTAVVDDSFRKIFPADISPDFSKKPDVRKPRKYKGVFDFIGEIRPGLKWRTLSRPDVQGMALDLDGDGALEIINVNNGISVMDGATGKVRWRADAEYCSVPAAASLKGGKEFQILTGDREGFLTCFSGKKGKVLWKAKTAGRLDFSCPVTADMKGDGRLQVLAVNGDKISVYNGADGKILGSTPAIRVNGSNVPAVGDPDGDGVEEFCVFDADGTLWVFKYPGKTVFKLKIPGRADNGCPPVLADLNGDGVDDIILGGDSLAAVSVKTGKILWQSRVKGDSSPVPADLDGDGELEIITSTGLGVAVVRGRDGKNLFNISYNQLADKPGLSWTWLIGSPSVADLDGDGKAEIIALQCREPDKTIDSYYFYQNIFVLKGNDGAKLGRIYLETLFAGTPVLGDFDGDGRVDMLSCMDHPTTGRNLLECFSFPKKGRILWPFSGGEPGNSRNWRKVRRFVSGLAGKGQKTGAADYLLTLKGDESLNRAGEELERGNYAGAEKLADAAGESYEKAAFETGLALSMIEKGRIYFVTGRMAKALEILKDAEKIAKKYHDDWSLAQWALAVGEIQLQMGSYRDAVQRIKTAGLISGRMDSGPLKLKAAALEGRLYFLLKEPARALDAFLRAESIGGDDNQKASIALETAGYMQANGRSTDSARMYLKALQLFQNTGNREGAIGVLTGAASLYSQKGFYQESFRLQEKALNLSGTISQKSLEPGILTDMGFSCLSLNQKEKALKYFLDGLNRIDAKGLILPEVKWKTHYGLAKAYESMGRDQDALGQYKKSVRTIESLRGEIGSPELRSRFMEDKFPVYEGLIRLMIKTGRGREAFEYSERAKARAFMDMLKSPRIKGNLKEKSAGYERLMKLQLEIATLRNRLNEDPSLSDRLGSRLREARDEYEREVSRIRLENPRLSLISGAFVPLSAGEVKSRFIDDSTALVEYFTGSDFTAVWVIDSEGLHEPIVKDVGFKSLSALVSRLRRPLMAVASGGPVDSAGMATVLNRFSLKNAYDLYRIAFEDADRIIGKNGKVKTVIVIPDGPLNFYPLEALVSGEPGESGRTGDLSDYSNAPYLIKKYAFIYSPSASALDPQLKGKGGAQKNSGLMAVGNPVYVQDNLARKEKKTKSYTLAMADMRNRTFSPLPNSQREIDSIGRFFRERAQNVVILSGGNATEEKARAHMAEGGYLHFSCHGVLEQDNPLFSGLVLSLNSGGGDTSRDGFLEVFEVFNLELDSKLVVLSACETGLGNYLSGEGVTGLSRAFMYAGAQQVVVSLWAVADESTTDMMEIFYREMLKDGLKAPVALQGAKLQMLKKKGGNGLSYGHPFFWAPFVLMGREGRLKSAQGYDAAIMIGGIVPGAVIDRSNPDMIHYILRKN